MLRSIPPSGIFKSEKQPYNQACFLLAFVEDHAGIYDSIMALAANQDVEGTLMYKLLTVCGNLLNTNKGKKKQIVWLEETRSTLLKIKEKQQLL